MATSPHGEECAITVSDAMAVIDARGVVMGWSEGARQLTGYTAAEVTGRPAAPLLAGAPGPAWRALRRRAGAVVAVRRRDGRPVDLALRLVPLHTVPDGRRAYVVTAEPDRQERALGEGPSGRRPCPCRSSTPSSATCA